MGKSCIRTEKYMLPATIDGICSLVREILSGGHVKRLELDNDDSFVRAHRWSENTGLEEESVSWDGALRNVPVLQEYYSDGAEPFQVVVDMLLLAQQENTHGICWATGVGNEDLLRKWFDVDGRKLPVGSIDSLLDIRVRRLKSLPEETLILCCSKYRNEDPEDVAMAIKTSMELEKENGTSGFKDAGRSGSNSKEHASATGQLVLTTGGLRRVPWKPSS
jgi:hypothetical protein